MVSVLQSLTLFDTSKISFSSSKVESTDVALIQHISDVSRSHSATPLELLFVEFQLPPLSLYLPFESIELINTDRHGYFAMDLAPTLRVLKVCRDLYHERNILKRVSSCLDVLDVSHTMLSHEHLDFLKFVGLKELYMNHCVIGPSTCLLRFPDSLELLDLDYCSLTSIKDVKFPKNLFIELVVQWHKDYI